MPIEKFLEWAQRSKTLAKSKKSTFVHFALNSTAARKSAKIHLL